GLTGTVGLDLTFGISLGDLASGKSIDQAFFIKDTTVTASGTFTFASGASPDLGLVQARLAPGTTVALTFNLALADPINDPADGGRIHMSELSLSNLSGFIGSLSLGVNVTGTVGLDLGGLVFVTTTNPNFTLKSVNVDLDGNGLLGPGDLRDASLMTVSLGSISAFAGVGASLNPDATLNVPPSAVGFSVAGANMTLALLKPKEADIAAGDGRSWLGLSGSMGT